MQQPDTVQLSNGVTMPYVRQGSAADVPLLLLHGFAGSWRSFQQILAHLPRSIAACAVTLRGHGEASKPADGYHISNLAEDVALFMEAMALDGAVLVGHSMGATVALQFALRHPRRTRGLVLAAACLDEPGDPRLQAYWETTVSKLQDPLDPAFVADFLQSTFAEPIPADELETLVQESMKVPAHVWQAAWKGRLQAPDFRSELESVAAPTLLIWGEKDARCGRRDQEKLLARIEDAHLLVYAGAGHSVEYERAPRFAADLVAFMIDQHLA
jgi:non-heme chloroperoxidase